MPFDDPFGLTDNSFLPHANPFMPRRHPSGGLPPLSPDEEQGVLGKLGSSALGGLGYIGGVLDKSFGGRAIRGVLGGKPEELLSILPGSDMAGITKEENAVSGRDLLAKTGLIQKDDNSWGGFLGGLGTEMLLDPATYLTLGGKTAAGLAAQKAGTLAKGVAPAADVARGGLAPALQQAKSLLSPSTASSFSGDLAAQMKAGQSALATFGLPFTKEPLLSVGTGAGAQNFANKLGGIGDSLRFSAPGRAVAPLFDARLSALGPSPTTEAGQRVTREAADTLKPAEAAIRGQFLGDRPIGEKLGMTDPTQAAAANRELLGLLEAPQGSAPLPSRIPAFNDPAVQALIGDYRGYLDTARSDASAVGRKGSEFASAHGTQYFPRQLTPEGADTIEKTVGGGQKFLSSRNPNDLARLPELDIPGGTNAINDLVRDPSAMVAPNQLASLGIGQNLDTASGNIRSKYFNWTQAHDADLARFRTDLANGMLPERIDVNGVSVPNPSFTEYQRLQGITDQSTKLAQLVTGGIGEAANQAPGGVAGARAAWDTAVGAKRPWFQNNPLGEMMDYRLKNQRSNASADAFAKLVGAKMGTAAGPDTVALSKVLEQGTYGNANMQARMLADAQAKGLLPAGAQVQELSKLHVPAAEAADAMRYGQQFQMPREMNPLLQGWDTITNATKASQTTFLPLTVPTIMRNAGTEAYTNLMHGAGLGAAGEIQSLRGGGQLSSLGHLPGFAGMTPAQQTARFNELAWQHGIDIPPDKLAAMELVGKGAINSPTGPGVLAPIGGPKKGFMESLMGAFPRSRAEMNPLNVRGVGNATETTFAPVRAGQELMAGVDDVGRRSAFLSFLQQGYEPAQAAERAKMMRMSPGDRTGFERNVMMRAIPFYNWMRTAVPGMAGELAQRPGGLVGQSIRGTNELRQQEGLIPDYVGEGTAIPLGSRGEDGTQRYISGLGLPFEELNKFASNGPAPVQRTLQSLMGSLNPLIKAPIELATNTQLYSGRNLDDLYSRTGMGVGGDQLVMNSPLGTIARTASRFADPRKNPFEAALMSLSPVRVTDANMNQAAQVQGRRLLEDQLRLDPNVRSFERLYVPPDQMAQMSPEELQMLRLYQTLMERARQQRQGPTR